MAIFPLKFPGEFKFFSPGIEELKSLDSPGFLKGWDPRGATLVSLFLVLSRGPRIDYRANVVGLGNFGQV